MAWQHNGHCHVAVSDLTLAQLKELARQCQASLEAGPFQESNMETVMAWFMHPGARAPKATFWIRLMAGWVFVWEGVIKFVFVNQGVGRFTKLGMPMPGRVPAQCG